MNWYSPLVTVLTESASSTNVTFVPGAKPITPESIGREARWSRKNVPSGARRCSWATGRVGVALAPGRCAAVRLAGVERAATGFGFVAVRCVWAGLTGACCVGAGGNQRHATYATITTATTPNIIFKLKRRRMRPKSESYQGIKCRAGRPLRSGPVRRGESQVSAFC